MKTVQIITLKKFYEFCAECDADSFEICKVLKEHLKEQCINCHYREKKHCSFLKAVKKEDDEKKEKKNLKKCCYDDNNSEKNKKDCKDLLHCLQSCFQNCVYLVKKLADM
ncbi:MAG: hypothetical protein LQ347_005748 [Umbilicaria vellea]|nr:MAG: hypothetical protein LQ347_005748 [Umbilicaria vellea]